MQNLDRQIAYVTAREVKLATVPARIIPKGTKLSDVYNGAPGADTLYAIAHHDGRRDKIVLRRDEIELATRECDVCGKMKPDVKSVLVSYAGETSACDDCRGINN